MSFLVAFRTERLVSEVRRIVSGLPALKAHLVLGLPRWLGGGFGFIWESWRSFRGLYRTSVLLRFGMRPIGGRDATLRRVVLVFFSLCGRPDCLTFPQTLSDKWWQPFGPPSKFFSILVRPLSCNHGIVQLHVDNSPQKENLPCRSVNKLRHVCGHIKCFTLIWVKALLTFIYFSRIVCDALGRKILFQLLDKHSNRRS